MKILKNYKQYLKLIIYILLISSFQAILNIVINIPNSINQLLSLILLGTYLFISNLNIGKRLDDKAYIHGIKNGLITTLTLILLSIITFTFTFNFKTILYYLIIIFISILGCIIGINKKR